jgi:hypothetical protein
MRLIAVDHDICSMMHFSPGVQCTAPQGDVSTASSSCRLQFPPTYFPSLSADPEIIPNSYNTAMSTHSELPDEIWEVIFELATEDERIYTTRFPLAMERTEWFPHVEGYWVPRGPSEVINQLQRKGYATKKASMCVVNGSPLKYVRLTEVFVPGHSLDMSVVLHYYM